MSLLAPGNRSCLWWTPPPWPPAGPRRIELGVREAHAASCREKFLPAALRAPSTSAGTCPGPAEGQISRRAAVRLGPLHYDPTGGSRNELARAGNAGFA